MKAFRFKLERILSLRKHREREWEIKLAGLTGECVRLQRDIDERAMLKNRALRSSPRANASAMLSNHLYMSRLDQESQKISRELAERERRRVEVEAEYLEASKERKVLDKLKEKRSAGYLREQRIEEVKQIDDINSGRAARRGD